MDLVMLCNALSAWYLYCGVFASFATCPSKCISLGGMTSTLEEPWKRYMDVTEGTTVVTMPCWCWSLDKAIEMTNDAIKTAVMGTEAELLG